MWILWVRHLGSAVWHKELGSDIHGELELRMRQVLRGPSVAEAQIHAKDHDPNPIVRRR